MIGATQEYTGRALERGLPREDMPKAFYQMKEFEPIERDWLLVASSPLMAQRVTISEIQAAVCNHYGIRLSDLFGHRRLGSIIEPRFVSMWLCKKITARSDAYIAKAHRRSDHTVTLNAMERVRSRMRRSDDFTREIEALRASLEGRLNG